MKRIYFEGYSDDTFSCSCVGLLVDHDNCASGKPIEMRVSGSGGEMIVTGQYCPGRSTGWAISVAPAHDDPDENPIPPWPIHIERSGRPYSPRLVVEVPDDVTVTLLEAV